MQDAAGLHFKKSGLLYGTKLSQKSRRALLLSWRERWHLISTIGGSNPRGSVLHGLVSGHCFLAVLWWVGWSTGVQQKGERGMQAVGRCSEPPSPSILRTSSGVGACLLLLTRRGPEKLGFQGVPRPCRIISGRRFRSWRMRCAVLLYIVALSFCPLYHPARICHTLTHTL